MDQDIKLEFEKLTTAVKDGFDAVDKRFDEVDGRLDKVEGRLDRVESDISVLKKDVSDLKATLKTQYPDKTYLDNKLADTVSDIVQQIMKRDEKDRNFKLSLLELLEKQSVLSQRDVDSLKLFVG